MRRAWLLPLVSCLCLGFAGWHVVRAQQQPPRAVPAVAPAHAAFGKTVAGAGLVEARTQNISLGSPVSGVVSEVFVKVGCRVRPGDPLFLLDARQIRADLQVKEAALKASEAQYDRLREMPRVEELPASTAKVKEAEANLAERTDNRRRAERLFATHAVGREELVRAEQGMLAANAQLERAKADDALLHAGAWKADLEVARAQIVQAKAQVEQARIELARYRIDAPTVNDCGKPLELEVMQVNVRPGEFVGVPPSQPAMMLGNVAKLHVRVDIDEHDIPRFRTTAAAKASVRGAADAEHRLVFERIEPYVIPKKSLTGDSSERVDTRVLQVIYAVDGPAKGLFVGQQMDVYVSAEENAPPASDSAGLVMRVEVSEKK